MNILFITPSHNVTIGLNQGVAILSALLKRDGHSIDYVLINDNLGYRWDDWQNWLPRKIAEVQPDLIGHSVMTPQWKYSSIIGRFLKQNYPEIVQAVGGPHPSQYPEQIFAEAADFIDFICLGEGDNALPSFLRKTNHKELVTRTYPTDVKGLWFRFADGRVEKTSNDVFVDLSQLPPEDKSIFDLDAYIKEKGNQMEVTVGRGCPYKCTYCFNEAYFNLYKKDNPALKIKNYLRFKSMDVVFEEIKDALRISNTPIQALSFVDDNFLISHDFLQEFCGRYKDEIGLPFVINVHPLTLNEAKGELLKKAGVISMRFGIESGSERVRTKILKRFTSPKHLDRAFDIARRCGAMPSSYNMIGIPTESRDELLDTLRLNARLSPDVVKVMTFYPFNGTPLFDHCVEQNLIDFKKREQLDNYDSGTCLKFEPDHQLFLKKVQKVFPWYLNIYSNQDQLGLYERQLDHVLRMEEREWDEFDYETANSEISLRMSDTGQTYYTTHFNDSIAIKVPDFWDRSALQRQHEVADPGEAME